jgi:hypothetical protein
VEQGGEVHQLAQFRILFDLSEAEMRKGKLLGLVPRSMSGDLMSALANYWLEGVDENFDLHFDWNGFALVGGGFETKLLNCFDTTGLYCVCNVVQFPVVEAGF